MDSKLGWNQMGTRERVFAARLYLVHGKSVADAQRTAKYNPRLDLVDGRAVRDVRDSANVIRVIYPSLFPSDEAVLRTLGVCHYCGSAFDDQGRCRCQ